jgi:hypothetical protein
VQHYRLRRCLLKHPGAARMMGYDTVPCATTIFASVVSETTHCAPWRHFWTASSARLRGQRRP